MTERRTILVVEDDPIIREMMHDVLDDEGLTGLYAENTEQAIRTIDGADGDDIGALFADIDLGDRRGGYEVARHARRIKPNIEIIYTSGGAREDLGRERVDGAEFVQKPYSPSQVCMMLKRKLAG